MPLKYVVVKSGLDSNKSLFLPLIHHKSLRMSLALMLSRHPSVTVGLELAEVYLR